MVAKTDDEICVLSTIKRCSYFSFVISTVPKKIELMLCNFIEIALRHGCSPVNLLHIFRTPFLGTPLVGYF